MQILKVLVWLYSYIRRKLNPVKMPKGSTSEWKEVKDFTLKKFSYWLDGFPYLSDRIHGLLDKTESFEHFVDLSVKHGRDCDDFARMWTLYGKYNGYNTKEAIVARSKFPFKFHVVSILEKNGDFYLCDYKNYGPFKNIEECKDNLCQRWETYDRETLIWVDWDV